MSESKSTNLDLGVVKLINVFSSLNKNSTDDEWRAFKAQVMAVKSLMEREECRQPQMVQGIDGMLKACAMALGEE